MGEENIMKSWNLIIDELYDKKYIYLNCSRHFTISFILSHSKNKKRRRREKLHPIQKTKQFKHHFPIHLWDK